MAAAEKTPVAVVRGSGHPSASKNVTRLLSHDDATLFFRLQKTQLCFVKITSAVSASTCPDRMEDRG